MSLNESIIKIRVELQNTTISKSGKNKFANFDYYELSDFLPTLNILMKIQGVNDQITINNDYAELILIKKDERQVYQMPFIMFDTPKGMQGIQHLGALTTYYKRYLYLNAFGITDGEVIDSMNNNEINTPQQPATLSQGQIATIEKKLKETNSNTPDFLKLFKTESLGLIHVGNYNKAIELLDAKAKQIEKSKNATPTS